MTVYKHNIAGERVTIQHLPPPMAEGLWVNWLAHVEHNEGGIAGLDVETTAIDDVLGPFEPDAKLRLVQFGSRRYAWALDPHDPFWRPRIADVLNRGDLRFVSHTNYDVLWARREFGTPADERFIDTIVMAALLWPGVTQLKGLKDLADRYIDTNLSEAEAALHARFRELAPVGQRVGKTLKRWGFTNIPLDDPIFGLYGGLDAIVVRRLLDILSAMIKKVRQPNFTALSRREQKINNLATQMRQRGMRVDQNWTHGLLETVEAEFNAADERLAEVWGFARRSPKRGAWLEGHGAEFVEFTPSGQAKLTMPSAADPGTLPLLAERYESDSVLGPIFADMMILGGNSNMMANLKVILAQSAVDGFVHPQIRTQAAHTGRMSIIKPAVQTLKKRDPRLRGCFIAREGYVLVGADYASQEVRVAAAFSRDELLLRVVRDGLNQHLETCKAIFGVADKETIMDKLTGKTYYDASKTLDFAQQYGAGPFRIGAQLGYKGTVDPESGRKYAHPKARKMWQAWRDAYAGLVAWTEEIGEAKLITNPFGRRIPADRYRSYANGNYAVQSTGRDILGAAIERLAVAGWGDYFWLPMHDELILEVPEAMAEAAADALTEHMSTTLRDIEIPAKGVIIGTRWGVGE